MDNEVLSASSDSALLSASSSALSSSSDSESSSSSPSSSAFSSNLRLNLFAIQNNHKVLKSKSLSSAQEIQIGFLVFYH
jgi:hypothetical protein